MNHLSAHLIVILLAKPFFNIVFDLKSTCKSLCAFCGSIPPFSLDDVFHSAHVCYKSQLNYFAWKHLIIVQDQIKHTAYTHFCETHVEFGD